MSDSERPGAKSGRPSVGPGGSKQIPVVLKVETVEALDELAAERGWSRSGAGRFCIEAQLAGRQV